MKTFCCALLCYVPIAISPLWAGDDWPQFRGSDRDGMSTETELLNAWPETGPKEVWRQPLGEGYSAVSVVGDRIYTMYATDIEGTSTEVAACMDTATGSTIWQTPLCERYDTEFGNGPRSTPTVDGNMVYVFSSRGDLAGLKVDDGSVVWKLNAPEQFGSKIPGWGYSGSPLVDGDQVVIEVGGEKNTISVDKQTGEVAWTYGGGPAGYNSALPIKLGGKDQYVCIYRGKLVGLTPDGSELWSYEWPRGETHAMPVLIPPNRIFASGVEGVGATVLEFNDALEAKEVWKSPMMRNHFSTSIHHSDHIFGFDNATLKCISATDGAIAWAKRGLGKGSMIFADGQLYVLSDRGLLLLLDATSEAFTQKGKVQALQGRCWTAPSLSRGKLYLRNHSEIVCFDVSG